MERKNYREGQYEQMLRIHSLDSHQGLAVSFDPGVGAQFSPLTGFIFETVVSSQLLY
jgi:hypothetical protein